MDGYALQSFDDAALEAMRDEATLDRRTRALERAVHALARRYRGVTP
jgi:hypothetical protein